jgi:replicative DNA helicase
MAEWLPEKLPEDIDAERVLLATLCSPGAEKIARREAGRLTPEHFVHPAHRAVFEALVGLIDQRFEEFGALNLKVELERQKNLGRVGGFPGLIELLGAEEVGRPQVLTDRLTLLLKRRQAIRLGASLVRLAAEDEEDIATLIGNMMTQLGNIQREGRGEAYSSWLEILEMAGQGEAFREGSASIGGFWGIESLDLVAPIPAGQVTGVFARPGVGKTALGTQIVCESAMRGKKPLFVSLELPKKVAQARIASYYAKVSTRLLKEGRYDANVVEALRSRAATLANGGIISPRQGTPWAEIEATILEARERHGTDLVVIDQFSHVGRPAVAKGSSEAYSYAKVSEAITSFAKDVAPEMGVVLLGQLKQDSAGREPFDGDVADSDRPARDAAVSLMLWRDAKNQIHAALRKNRDGSLDWKRALSFEGWCQRFQVQEGEATVTADEKPYHEH